MTYAAERVLYDADSHIMELPNFLSDYADPLMRERIPAIDFSANSGLQRNLEERRPGLRARGRPCCQGAGAGR